MITHLLYLHGFRSSPRSSKARQIQTLVEQLNTTERFARQPITYWCPQLPPSPADTMALIEEGVSNWPAHSTAVIGSSLGGFYATVLTERKGFQAILVNPAVHPARDLKRYIGEQTYYHDPQARFLLRSEFIGELEALNVPVSRYANYFVLLATGDEVLNWQEMQQCYQACPHQVIMGGDHALSDFERYLPLIVQRLGWAAG